MRIRCSTESSSRPKKSKQIRDRGEDGLSNGKVLQC